MTDPIPVGIHYDIPEPEYHRDPALSQSQAKTLLDCPARYRWELDHPRASTKSMDTGTAIHALALTGKAAHQVVDARNWRTKEAKEAKAEITAAGLIPMLPAEAEEVEAAALAVREHPTIAPMLERGHPEVTLRWDDPETGVHCRGRADWITEDIHGTPVIVDLKTAHDISGDMGRNVAKYDYHMQAAHYVAGHEALTGKAPAFLYVFVEQSAPHLPRVIHADRAVIQQGRMAMDDALRLYAKCTEADEWPGYPPMETISLPPWAAGGIYA